MVVVVVVGLQAQKERRLEESLNKETERSGRRGGGSGAPRGPRGFGGSGCWHNERSQTYPASLISTIKANTHTLTLTLPFCTTRRCFCSRLQKALTCHLRSKPARGTAEQLEGAATFLSCLLSSFLSSFLPLRACGTGGGLLPPSVSLLVATADIRQGVD